MDTGEKLQSYCFYLPASSFWRIARQEIEITLGLNYRHDLPGENGKQRRGLAVVERADVDDAENVSVESG